MSLENDDPKGEKWINKLKKASRKLCEFEDPKLPKAKRIFEDDEKTCEIYETEPTCPIWWNGFDNVIRYNQSSHDDDNPYTNIKNALDYRAYKAGAKAGESLKKYLKLDIEDTMMSTEEFKEFLKSH